MDQNIINKILDAAIKAPSGDNVQPWAFQVSEDFLSVSLYNLPEKDHSYYNYQQTASYIALGAVIENISIAASHLGLQAAVALFPSSSESDLVAQINFSPTDAQEEPLYAAIFQRETNRFPFKRVEISDAALTELRQSTDCIEGAAVHLVHEQDKVNTLAKELMVNDQLVFERKDIHRFLFDKIRWNQQQVDATKDGLPVETMGLNFADRLSFPLMRFWGFVKAGNYMGLSNIIAYKSNWNCRKASVLGMVTIKGDDKVAFVQGGRAVQRLWLQVTAQGFALQPIIGLTLLIHRFKQKAISDLSAKHQGMITRVAEQLPLLFGTDRKDTLVMGFRVGEKISDNTVKTQRRHWAASIDPIVKK